MEINIPKGYKKTDVGLIPQDWEIYYLYEITKKITDGEHATPKRTTEGYYLLSARNVHNGLIDLTDVDFVGADEYQRIRKRCDPEANDILISCSGTIGRVAVLPSGIECVMVRSAALIKPNRTQTNSYFIQYILQSRVGQTQILQSLNQGAQANLFLNHIERLKIPFPPLPEQKAIAQSLSDVDALIAALDQLITKKRNIKQGTMQQLLTGKKRLPGFSGEWEVKNLEDISEKIMVGIASAATHAYSAKGIILFRNQNIKDGYLDDKDILYIKDKYEELFKNKRLKSGDLIIARTGYPGTACVIPPKYEGTQSFTTLIVRPKSRNIRSDFLCYFINSEIGQSFFEVNQIGGGQKNVNAGSLKFMSMPVPSLPEQQAIAQVLSDMDAEIEDLEQKRDKYKAIKQGMMQELLTGKTRLIDQP